MIFFLLSFIDLLYSPKKTELHFRRSIPKEMERGLTYQVEILINNASNYPLNFRFVDGIPQSFKRDQFPFKGKLSGQTSGIATYETVAPVRGKYNIEKLYFRYKSTFGLWEKQVTLELKDELKVIPDLTETKSYLEDAQKFLLHEGIKIRKHLSGAGEFTKVRSFVVGDDPRKINWRQTAKLQEVMTNEYEPEHGKYVTILIDCGRMMGAELRETNRLEKAVEASLTVAAAALQKGDYVSILVFSRDIKVYVPPAKGIAHLQTILQAVYDVQVDQAESNYAAVFTYLQSLQKKRSFIMLFSDIRTFLYEESALIYLKRIRQRHYFLMIGIEDELIKKKIRLQPIDIEHAMVKSIAQQQMLMTKREKVKWEKQGLQMLEAKEDKLATVAVSQYIDIMNRGLL